MTIPGLSTTGRPDPSRPLRSSHEMLRPKRILFALLTFVSAVIYVWVAAVRAVPEVRRRKEAARRSRGA